MTKVGTNTSVSALVGVAGIDRIGPPYLIKSDSPAEMTSTLRMNPACFI